MVQDTHPPLIRRPSPPSNTGPPQPPWSSRLQSKNSGAMRLRRPQAGSSPVFYGGFGLYFPGIYIPYYTIIDLFGYLVIWNNWLVYNYYGYIIYFW